MIKLFKEKVAEFDGTELVIAVADITFEFPDTTLYPNLCVHHKDYGLISPLSGRTLATLPEIHLALRMGCKIIYHDAFVINSKDEFVYGGHLKKLIDDRNQAKKDGNKLMDQMLKLYVNTLYGKVAQGISVKKGYDLREEGTKELGTCAVSQAYFATMITGVLRAALSALLAAITELNKEGYNYLPISATTDGMLYGVAPECGIDFRDVVRDEFHDDIFSAIESGDNVFKPFAEVDPVLFNKLQEFPVLRMLQQSRASWGYDEFIEIKHAVNEVLNVKTRGQAGAYRE